MLGYIQCTKEVLTVPFVLSKRRGVVSMCKGEDVDSRFRTKLCSCTMFPAEILKRNGTKGIYKTRLRRGGRSWG